MSAWGVISLSGDYGRQQGEARAICRWLPNGSWHARVWLPESRAWTGTVHASLDDAKAWCDGVLRETHAEAKR